MRLTETRMVLSHIHEQLLNQTHRLQEILLAVGADMHG